MACRVRWTTEPGSLAIMALVIIGTAISEHSITSPVMNVIN